LDKSLKSIKNKFQDTLAIALDAAIYEIDQDKRQEVEIALSDMINDTFNKFSVDYTRTMNKAAQIVENGLSK
jgi:hypothetical protein